MEHVRINSVCVPTALLSFLWQCWSVHGEHHNRHPQKSPRREGGYPKSALGGQNSKQSHLGHLAAKVLLADQATQLLGSALNLNLDTVKEI